MTPRHAQHAALGLCVFIALYAALGFTMIIGFALVCLTVYYLANNTWRDGKRLTVPAIIPVCLIVLTWLIFLDYALQ